MLPVPAPPAESALLPVPLTSPPVMLTVAKLAGVLPEETASLYSVVFWSSVRPITAPSARLTLPPLTLTVVFMPPI